MAKKTTAKASPKKATAKNLVKKRSSEKTSSKKASMGEALLSKKMKAAPKRAEVSKKAPPLKKMPPKKMPPKKRLSTPCPLGGGLHLKRAAAQDSTSPVQLPTVPKTGGAIVGGVDPCTCGDSPEEHGRDPRYPGSTRCNVTECGCVAYEADPESIQEDPETPKADPGSLKEDTETGTADPGIGEEACEEDPGY